MILLLIIVNTFILLALSFLHFYWAFGGRWGWQFSLPTKENGDFLFQPGIFATLVVAFGLFIFATTTTGNAGLYSQWVPVNYFHYADWVMAVVFALRAIGDFHYVGLFKKVTATKFAENDSRIYSPLCILISAISMIIGVYS
jgi:hypothetical protein